VVAAPNGSKGVKPSGSSGDNASRALSGVKPEEASGSLGSGVRPGIGATGFAGGRGAVVLSLGIGCNPGTRVDLSGI